MNTEKDVFFKTRSLQNLSITLIYILLAFFVFSLSTPVFIPIIDSLQFRENLWWLISFTFFVVSIFSISQCIYPTKLTYLRLLFIIFSSPLWVILILLGSFFVWFKNPSSISSLLCIVIVFIIIDISIRRRMKYLFAHYQKNSCFKQIRILDSLYLFICVFWGILFMLTITMLLRKNVSFFTSHISEEIIKCFFW